MNIIKIIIFLLLFFFQVKKSLKDFIKGVVMELIKINNTEIIFKVVLDKFNKCNLIIKDNDIIKYNIIISDNEMLNSLRCLYLYKNDNLNLNDILKLLNKNIISNILK